MIEKISKIIFIFLFGFSLVSLPFITYNLDWQTNWIFPAFILVFLFLLIVGIFNFKKLILFLIIILPASFQYNHIKLNIANFLPALKNYNLPLNFSALICAFIIFLATLAILLETKKLKKIPLKIILILYTVYIIISMAWSSDLGVSLVGLVYFLCPFAIYILAYLYFSKVQGFINIILTVIASSAIPIIIAIGQILTKNYFFEPDSSLARLKGPFVHPNLFGLYLFIILAVSISLYLAKAEKKINQNKLLILYNILIFIIFLLTYSRVPWACFILFLILLLIINKKFIFSSGVIASVLAIIFLSIDTMRERILELFNSALFNSWIARKNIWRVAWKEILDKPILGHGLGTSEMVIEEAKNWRGGTSLPHNDYILYGLELGIFGVFFFLTYTLGAIFYAYKTFTKIANKEVNVKIFKKNIKLNLKILIGGILITLISLLLVSFFESISRRIVTQAMIWAILGSLFTLKND